MSRDWKPGDVARYAGLRVFLLARSDGLVWIDEEGDEREIPLDAVGSPLVVIDPSEHLLGRMIAESLDFPEGSLLGDAVVTATNDALGRFAARKPREPKGLGAVAEDAHGDRWVLFSLEERGGRGWASASGRDETNRAWSGIDVIRVLSEGVEP